MRAKTEGAKQRISDLDKLFSRIYEDNILGKLSDERYSRMASEYEAEQKHLISEVEENESTALLDRGNACALFINHSNSIPASLFS